MLTLSLGRAATGKTRRAMHDFADRISSGQENLYYIVPEQYSHDAERRLLGICGDTLSLHGEVLSFSRLTSRVFAELGGLSDKLLDAGGRLLLMSRAFDDVSGSLTHFGKSERRTQFLEKLTMTARELKSACVSPQSIDDAAAAAGGTLGVKLRDLSIIYGAYDAAFTGDAADPDERLNRLARVMPDSTLFDDGYVCFDGFTDFTAQELRIIEILIRMNVEVTVCLTCDGLDGTDELFLSSRQTAQHLLRVAQENGVEAAISNNTAQDDGRVPALDAIERWLMSGSGYFDGDVSAVTLIRASSPASECEMAAAKVLELVRSGYRWRDIAVAVCDYQAVGEMCRSIFEKYGVPVFVSQKTAIANKPPLAVVESALDIAANGFDVESIFRYLKTGMTDMPDADRDVLENYALLWDLRGAVWTRDEPWRLSPSGYERGDEDADAALLANLDAIRRRAVGPLDELKKALTQDKTFGGKLRALYSFLERIGLPERVHEKADAYVSAGELQLGDEYKQLWDILIRAMDQFYSLLGDKTGSTAEFARLWKLLISQYDIGTIPVSLDRVGIGELARQRRKGIKCLLVIGASDDELPALSSSGGILSDAERDELRRLGVAVTGSSEQRLFRELNTIYQAMTLPSDRLIVSYAAHGLDGGEKRPSFLVKRLQALLGIRPSDDPDAGFRLSAEAPAFELAASYSATGIGKKAAASAAYFQQDEQASARLREIAAAASLPRGHLTKTGATALYGKEISMSASRVDKYYACRYQYFMQYGLSAHPRKPAGFDAPTAGTFMHFVLENVTRELKETGDFRHVSEARCRELTDKFVHQYIDEVLCGFDNKTRRFRYLFDRLKKDAVFIVLDMVRELSASDFEPIDFELAFSENGDVPPHVLKSEEVLLKVKGFIDRLDAWEQNGKLYLRVVDYKTGKKKFSLSDVWYGMNMQMLIYLFALGRAGATRYGRELVTAGVLYAPARDEILKTSRYESQAALDEKRAKNLRRSGLILDDPEVLEAMEHGDDKRYLPTKSADSLASLAQLGKLAAHIDKRLLEIAEHVHGGSIDAEPFYRNEAENACLYCDYRTPCHFGQRDGDKRRYLKKLDADTAWARISKEADDGC